MGLTKTFRLVFFAAILFVNSLPLCPQEASLAAEIQSIDKKLKTPGLSGAERRGVLLRLARLLRLSGNVEGAAQVWMEAAFAEQGKRDDLAMLEGAACFIAQGELDRAEAVVKTVLLTGRDRRALLRARYTAAWIEAFKFGSPAALAALAEDPDYGDLRPAAYYALWKIFGLEGYKTRLAAEFPASPEGRIVRDEKVSASPQAMWFLFPGRENAGPVTPARSEDPPAAGRAGISRAPDPGPGEGPRAIQTGLFSREENARAMAERLRIAGFTAAVNQRTVNGSAYWAVSIPPGADPDTTVLRLRDAGFEAFPVF
jgi:hypothetical protein